MNAIASLGGGDRRDVFNETATIFGLPPFHIEKDFWVCWVLEVLFADPQVGPNLTFRGGTSLSKGWGLIERFSEDIDLAMARAWMGEVPDPGETGITSSERDRRLRALRHECRRVIEGVLAPVLEREASNLPDTSHIEIEALDRARDPFCIHFHYPTTGLSAPAEYNRAAVKIELSGRAENWPMEGREITAYVAESFPHLGATSAGIISCARPERTFWEKASLIHEQNARPEQRPLEPRQARHLYDLVRLWDHVADLEGMAELFAGVKAHRGTFFGYAWVDYDTLKPENLRLVPKDERLVEWRADYVQMSPMFFGAPPTFEEILDGLRSIENALQTP